MRRLLRKATYYSVIVNDVDGQHVIDTLQDLEEAKDVALDWLGSGYTTVGKDSWVSRHGTTCFIRESDTEPKKCKNSWCDNQARGEGDYCTDCYETGMTEE